MTVLFTTASMKVVGTRVISSARLQRALTRGHRGCICRENCRVVTVRRCAVSVWGEIDDWQGGRAQPEWEEGLPSPSPSGTWSRCKRAAASAAVAASS